MKFENIDKLLIIRDFITYLDEENIYQPTTEDVKNYVNFCAFDIANDDTIVNKKAFEKCLFQHLNNFINFLK